MARDDADIDRTKSGIIPDRYLPRDAAGALTSAFGSVDKLAQHNLSVGFVGSDASEAAPNFILSGAQAASRAMQITEIEKRKRDDERFAFDRMTEALEQRLAALDAELAAIDQRLAEIRQRRAQIGVSMEAIDEIEQIRRSGRTLDARNPAHRRLLESAGITEQEANGDNYAFIANQRRRALDGEHRNLGTEENGLMKRRDHVARMRTDIADVGQDIESADTDEARLLAERRATSVLGAQQLGGAAYQTDNSNTRVIAADAVASQEAEPVRADSAAFARKAVTDPTAIVKSDNTSFVPS